MSNLLLHLKKRNKSVGADLSVLVTSVVMSRLVLFVWKALVLSLNICLFKGGLEFMPRASTLSAPFYKTRPESLPAHLPSVTMMSVDILPTALPWEASKHFSGALYPYLQELIRDYRVFGTGEAYKPSGESRSRLDALHRATVARDGILTEPFQWLEGPLGIWRQSSTKPASTADSSSKPSQASTSVLPGKQKRVLVLGSGMVAGPAIDEICSWTDTQLIVGM